MLLVFFRPIKSEDFRKRSSSKVIIFTIFQDPAFGSQVPKTHLFEGFCFVIRFLKQSVSIFFTKFGKTSHFLAIISKMCNFIFIYLKSKGKLIHRFSVDCISEIVTLCGVLPVVNCHLFAFVQHRNKWCLVTKSIVALSIFFLLYLVGLALDVATSPFPS